VWREFDRFVTSHTPRWAGRAQAILNAEGNGAARGYAAAGIGAAIAAVEDADWLAYLRQLWMTVVPDAGALIEPFLGAMPKSAKVLGDPKAARVIADPLMRAAVEWVRANGAREAALISNASRKGIQDQIRIGVTKNESQEQIAARIRKHYRSIRQSRAETIARTEVHAAANYGSLSAAAESEQSLAKIWVDTPDARTRDTHVSAGGQKKPLREPFLVDGERLMHPGDGSMGASSENLVNCRCTLFYTAMRRAMPVKPRRRRAA
jgi:hypothetical protein